MADQFSSKYQPLLSSLQKGAGEFGDVVERRRNAFSQIQNAITPVAPSVQEPDTGKKYEVPSAERTSFWGDLGTQTVPYGGSTKFEKFHPGVDIANKMGTIVPSFTAGVVVGIETNRKKGDKGYGNYVIVQDEKGMKHRYSHLNKSNVQVGQKVTKGMPLGQMGNCFDNVTEILTEGGWKLFSELDQTERVVTLNMETQKIELQKPTNYVKKKYEKMYSFKNKQVIDFVVSGDHNMLIQLHQDQKMKRVELQDLPNRSYVKLNGFDWEGEEIEYKEIESCSKKINQHGGVSVCDSMTIKMDDWLEFLGWVLSDGSVFKNGYAVCITQSMSNPIKRRKIKSLLNRLPFKFKMYGNDFRIHDKQLHSELSRYANSENKHIPDFVFSLSQRQIRIFLDAFWLGDGWKHKTTKHFIFGDKKMADDVQTLLLLSGSCGTIREYDPSDRKNVPKLKNGKEIRATKKYWVITENKTRFASIVKKQIEEIDYNNFAYCVTVPNQTIYVRRNGKVMFCGNSGSTYSTTGGDGTHLDYRIYDAYNKYINPYKYMKQYYEGLKY